MQNMGILKLTVHQNVCMFCFVFLIPCSTNMAGVLQKLESDYSQMRQEILSGVRLEQLKPLSVALQEVNSEGSYTPSQVRTVHREHGNSRPGSTSPPSASQALICSCPFLDQCWSSRKCSVWASELAKEHVHPLLRCHYKIDWRQLRTHR